MRGEIREDARVTTRSLGLYPVSTRVEGVKPARSARSEGFGWKRSSPGREFCWGSFGHFQSAANVSGIRMVFQIFPNEYAGSLVASEVTSRRCLYPLNEGREKAFKGF